ncbi:phage tail sheath family protein [uncultured Clostridium sp.]|uniref:phage tail sheath family protein n=1 Tax=uncultured Clostridium sp. TaxID=59620 RepID=UPI00258BE22C|nr:phage tail sheath family protein [uncultured Clostridium sp.]MDU1348270.1 phage tail sheath family protein [Clostridium argentinense]
MAGGTWTKQNKVRPGAYINFRSKKKEVNMLGERGIVTMPLSLPWGPEKQIIEISVDDDLVDVLGIDITDPSVKLIREAFKRATTLLLYRLNKGTNATATLEGLTINAKYSGTKGNNITIVIQNNIDNPEEFEVITLFEGKEVDKQIGVKTIEDIKSNNYVEFKGTGELKSTAGLPLKGGENGTVTNADYTDYLSAIELYEFNTMGIPTKDESIKAIATNFVKRLRESEGKKVQVVLENYPEADYEGVMSVKNGVILKDGEITADEAVAFVAGATAGANVNQSLTYSTYDGAIDVDKRYTNKEIEKALKNGEIIFTISNAKVVIEQDINTLKTFADTKNNEFRKNRVLRVLDGMANDIKRLWETSYIGKVSNNEDGRNLFKKDIIKYLETLQGISAVENVTPDDVEAWQGEDKDVVLSRVGVQPVDAMEKLYMDVEVR